MRRFLTVVLAFLLLVSGILSPSIEAASMLPAGKPSRGCTSRADATRGHECCCGHAAKERCPCEVAPDAPPPEPLERASVGASPERPTPALAAPFAAAPAPAPPSLAALARIGRHGRAACVGQRLHLLESVFRE